MTERSLWVRRTAGVLVALFAAVLMVLGGAGSAAAHAALVSTDPAQNSVVPSAPSAVTLTFSEGVTLSADSVRVLDPAGRQVDAGDSGRADGKGDTARVSLRGGLADGTYTVAWRAVSDDSHPVSGAFTFSIGAPSATVVPADSNQGVKTDGLISFLYDTGRVAAYVAFALLVGAVAFVLVCWPAGAAVKQVQQLLVTGWLGLLVATVVLLLLRGSYERGSKIAQAADPALAHVSLDGRIYTALAVRLLLLVLSGVYLALLVGQAGQPGEEPLSRPARSKLGLTGALLAVALAATWVGTDHSAVGIQVWLSLPTAVLHLLAMAAWLGGLATLLTGLRQGVEAASVERYSKVALGSVTVLALTGVYQSWRGVGSWSALTSTDYGRLLLIKVGCVAVMLGAAWFSRRWVARLWTDPVSDGAAARSGLRRSVLVEAGVAAVVLVVTTMLTSAPPGRVAQAVAALPPSSAAPAAPGRAVELRLSYDTGGRTANAKGAATVGVAPPAVGNNTVRLALDGPDGQPVEVAEVELTFTLPARDVGPLTVALQAEGTGRWAGTVQLPLAGEWVASLTVRTSDIDQATSVQKLTIGS
ncbi:FixH family protein [Kitasatospora sp. NPDC101801]|uniref:copper resistance CopC/CopD family protein n=1 Tax=Kitasatospora sp. NPDC101801 TaxID=3364103 RepID=UPI00382874E4